MINCQHVRPIAEGEKMPYVYTRHSHQPLVVRFDFVPKHTHRSSIGYVTVTIHVADRDYGPYPTSINTTTNVWNDRRSLRPLQTARQIQELVRGLNLLIETAWSSLHRLKEPVTGEMILQKAGLLEKEVHHA